MVEEPNRCVDFCVCSNCNELEIDNESEIDSESEINNESVIEYDLVIESEFDIENESISVDQVNNENIRPALVKSFNLLGRQQSIQEQSENILNGHALTRERPCLRDELNFTVPHIINGPSFQILSHLYGRASTRNLPRPSPYSLKDRPRRPSNCRDLGR